MKCQLCELGFMSSAAWNFLFQRFLQRWQFYGLSIFHFCWEGDFPGMFPKIESHPNLESPEALLKLQLLRKTFGLSTFEYVTKNCRYLLKWRYCTLWGFFGDGEFPYISLTYSSYRFNTKKQYISISNINLHVNNLKKSIYLVSTRKVKCPNIN